MGTVITYGTFDLFHVGHLRLLSRAKSLGDRLCVGISTDEFNLNMKDKVCTVPFADRCEIVAGLRCVDEVFPEENWEQKIADVKKFGADIFTIGADWEGKFDFLTPHCQVIYLERTANISTTDLRQHISIGEKRQFSR